MTVKINGRPNFLCGRKPAAFSAGRKRAASKPTAAKRHGGDRKAAAPADDFRREKKITELAREQNVKPYQFQKAFGAGAHLFADADEFALFMSAQARSGDY
jgi:hypothetical protein